MKKINNLIVLVLSIFIGSTFVFADEKYFYNNISISKEDYNNLINLGFTPNEIENMNEEEYNINKAIEGRVVSSITEYYETKTEYDRNNTIISTTSKKITGLDYENKNNKVDLKGYNGYIETNYKKMTTQIIQLQNSYRYKISLEWKTIPKNRNYDIIGIGITSNVFIGSSVIFQQNYCLKNGNCATTGGIIKKTATGGAALFQLPTSSSVNSLSSYLYFDVNKNTSATITELYAYGDYAHSTTSVNNISSSDYSINTSGIAIGTKFTTKFDEIPVAKAYWQGNW